MSFGEIGCLFFEYHARSSCKQVFERRLVFWLRRLHAEKEAIIKLAPAAPQMGLAVLGLTCHKAPLERAFYCLEPSGRAGGASAALSRIGVVL